MGIPKPKYAVFYPIRTGYLHSKRLGADGSADLIWSLTDGKPYVRRKKRPYYRAKRQTHGKRLDELRYYRNVKGVPKLIAHDSYKHLGEEDRAHETYRSAAVIWSYLNGGNLQNLLWHNSHDSEDFLEDPEGRKRVRLRPFPTNELLEIFVWHFFESLLQVFDDLHKRGVAHYNGYSNNVFFHFPNNKAKLPEVNLCDFDDTHSIDADIIGHELALLFINITMLMSRRSYDPTDTQTVEEALSSDLRLDGYQYLANPNRENPSPRFSKELLECRQALGEMCYDQFGGNFAVDLVDIVKPEKKLGKTALVSAVAHLRGRVEKHATRAKANPNTIPDLRELRRDKKPITPILYDSRVELLKNAIGGVREEELSGP